jgi:YbbR domain-containing protein
MDKLFNSNWFIKIISFFIAFMLFLMVNMDQFNTQPGGVFLPGTTASYTVEDVELMAYYDEERFTITEIPESVKVNLRGPQGAITIMQLTRPSYEVFVDLNDKEAGTHHVSIERRGFPSELSVSVSPQFVKVVMEEKKTVSIPVEIDLVNKKGVAQGYSLGTPIVTPINVEVTAAAAIIDTVAIAKVYVDVSDVNKTIEKSVPVKLYDHLGNELDLDVEPSVVDVTVPISSPNKSVPVKITREGKLPEGLSIKSITVEPKEVAIYGQQATINDISLVEDIILDVSEIESEQTLTLDIPKPPEVERIEPEAVQVTVVLVEEETRLLVSIPLQITGLQEGLSMEMLNPQREDLDITLKGAPTILEKTQREEIKAFLDLSQFSAGEHEVPVQIAGPQLLNFVPEFSKIRIRIYE